MTKRYQVKLNLARNCLRYIIKAYSIREIYIPYYICPTVISAIRKENCHIKFYHIGKDFFPKLENIPLEAFILYPNYFGICAKHVNTLSARYPNLIIDNAHNFYMPDCGLASFNSLRKFFNVKDGAYLYTSKLCEENFHPDDYFYKTFDGLTYEDMKENEIRLNNQDIKLISSTTERYLNYINLEQEKLKRLENFKFFHERYKGINELNIELTNADVPFVYPLLSKNDNIVEELEQEGHIILRYWNTLPDNFEEYRFYRNLIPIPLNSNIYILKNTLHQ
jgi:hypothetical protein